MCEQHVGPQVDQLFCAHLRFRTSGRKTSLDVDITALRPSESLELLSKFHQAHLGFCIVLGQAHQHPDAPHPVRLLRPRHERPRRRAAEKRDELAPFHLGAHSITSSARASTVAGTSTAIALAVLGQPASRP
jgi:hypothetical protein